MNRPRWQALAGGLELVGGVAAIVAVGALASWCHSEPRLSPAQQRVVDLHDATCRACRVPAVDLRISGLEDLAAPDADMSTSRPAVALPNALDERVTMAGTLGMPDGHPSNPLRADSSPMSPHR